MRRSEEYIKMACVEGGFEDVRFASPHPCLENALAVSSLALQCACHIPSLLLLRDFWTTC